MQLYWKNFMADGLWDTVDNWFEDAAATVAHGSLPGSGDDVTLAAGESGAPTMAAVGVDLGIGSCDIAGIVIDGSGGILSGIFTGEAMNNISGTLGGGTFSGNALTNSGVIAGGTFSGAGLINFGTINGGTFTGSSLTNDATGGISAGTFTGDGLTNAGIITGGTYAPNGTVAFADLIVDGVCTYATGSVSADPGFVAGGGTYAPVITVTGIPVASDILGTGML